MFAALNVKSRWTPKRLNPALWIEARRTDQLFQSNAGTTPVTDTSVCGYAGDLSGNGFHLTSAADDTTRPTWNAGGGYPYLNFDGSNDVLLRTAALGMYSTSGCSIFVAIRDVSNGAGVSVIAEGYTGGSNPLYSPIRSNGITATTYDPFIRDDVAATILNQGNTSDITNAWDGTDKVVGWTDDGAGTATVNTFVNFSSSASATYSRTTITRDRTSLGALVRNTTGSWFAARIYALVVVKRPITNSERRELTKYLGRRMGLSL